MSLHEKSKTKIRRRCAAAAAVILLEKREKRKKSKKYDVQPLFRKRSEYGFCKIGLETLKLDNVGFRNYCRMSTVEFEQLLFMVAPTIQKQFLIKEPISPEQRLLFTLRFLSSGDSLTSLTYSYLLGKTTASNIVSETCSALWDILHPLVMPVPTQSDWMQMEHNFALKWNFPHCILALDGKHIVLQCPPKAGSAFYNYKGTHSIVLLAACDAQYRFRMVDIGAYGRQSDGGILRNSAMGQMLLKNELNIPPPAPINGNGPCVPYVVVADEAFPLSMNIMRPYSGKSGLTNEKRVFNYRLSRARMVIENTFGIFSAKFRIFRKPILASAENAQKYVQAGVCLHNWLRAKEGHERGNDECEETNFGMSDSRNNANSAFLSVAEVDNVSSCAASKVRDQFKNYFNYDDVLPWQLKYTV